MSLRLGVMSAVTDSSGCILLSRRGDLNTWTLPGGRLDSAERLEDAAAREAWEETGIKVRIDRAIGLYYLAGWRRMNVLYVGAAVGGELREKTRETRANRYFRSLSLPQNVLGAKEALAGTRVQRVLTSTRADLWRLRLRFGWRWVVNRMSGHPEPKFPIFDVRAVAVILGDASRRVLTLPGDDQADSLRTLPRILCDGEAAPWDQLAQVVQRAIAVTPTFQWVGLFEDANQGVFEFVFAASLPETSLPSSVQWTVIRNAAFSDRDMAYVERVRPTYAHDPIWTLSARDEPNEITTLYQEAKP